MQTPHRLYVRYRTSCIGVLYNDSNEAPLQVSVGSQPRTCPRPHSLFLTSSRLQSNLCAWLPSTTTTAVLIFVVACTRLCASLLHSMYLHFTLSVIYSSRFYFASFLRRQLQARSSMRIFNTTVRVIKSQKSAVESVFFFLHPLYFFNFFVFNLPYHKCTFFVYETPFGKSPYQFVNVDDASQPLLPSYLLPEYYAPRFIFPGCTHTYSCMLSQLSIEIVTRTRYYARKCEDISFRCSKEYYMH